MINLVIQVTLDFVLPTRLEFGNPPYFRRLALFLITSKGLCSITDYFGIRSSVILQKRQTQTSDIEDKILKNRAIIYFFIT